MQAYHALDVQYDGAIAVVRLNRPDKRNALDQPFWDELPRLFQALDDNDAVRVVVLGAHGEHFCAGIDLALLGQVATQLGHDVARNARLLRRQILRFQAAFSAVAACAKPVLAAVSGHCLGAGVDLLAACDLRYCSSSARFSIKEVDMGMAADVGTLQRLPRIVGEGRLREWAYTGCTVEPAEALAAGLVNRVYGSDAELQAGVFAIARSIAAKSPLAVQGSKRMLDYMRDHRIDEGLEYVASWNAAMLQGADLKQALLAAMNRQPAVFDD
ncbi:crotonase/enoyl-CoA hydratase family protein [Pseudomonas sp. NPDC007930]|uniref:crotonase/enoyl-CoA hydratase family protein n=1 Tax=Pseudomonas sp. NPDC007930 TaxID=3364417 RepID=UPI0036E3DD93